MIDETQATPTPELLESMLPLARGVRVLKVDPNGVFAVNKPRDILSHPGSDDRPAILRARYSLKRRAFGPLKESCPWREVYLLNRLDSATSGVVLLALNPDVVEPVRTAFEQEVVEKVYLAMVKGRPEVNPPVWKDRVSRKKEGETVRLVSGSHQIAKTTHRWIQNDANGVGASLVELRPLTGRTHQLRYQCKRHKCPILGDKTYGDFSWNKSVQARGVSKRLFLHAHRIALAYELNGTIFQFEVEAERPEAFDALLVRNPDLRKAPTPRLTPNEKLKLEREKRQKELLDKPDPLKRKSSSHSRSRRSSG